MSKSTRWFLVILGVLALLTTGFVFLLISLAGISGGGRETVTSGSGERIALVEIRDVIVSSEEVVRQLKKYRDDRGIKAILLRLDSPGGGVVASQEIYEEVKKTRDGGKPIVVSMGSVAASGAYYIACGANRIVANRGTLTGSIGVISEFLQLQDALGKIGVGVKTVKAGRMKDVGSMTRKMSEQDERYLQGLLNEVHRQFIDVVREERKLSGERAVSLADGRVFTGEQAVDLGLVDTLGTYEDAVGVVAALAGIEGTPALVRERKRKSWWEGVFGEAGEAVAGITRDVLQRPILSYRYPGP
jgi:protease-4